MYKVELIHFSEIPNRLKHKYSQTSGCIRKFIINLDGLEIEGVVKFVPIGTKESYYRFRFPKHLYITTRKDYKNIRRKILTLMIDSDVGEAMLPKKLAIR